VIFFKFTYNYFDINTKLTKLKSSIKHFFVNVVFFTSHLLNITIVYNHMVCKADLTSQFYNILNICKRTEEYISLDKFCSMRMKLYQLCRHLMEGAMVRKIFI
jgi:hypothetical protein